MAAEPPYIKSRSDFIGPVSARFCDARRGTMGGKPLFGAVLFTFFRGIMNPESLVLTPRRCRDFMWACLFAIDPKP
jgi:hypothetical protein